MSTFIKVDWKIAAIYLALTAVPFRLNMSKTDSESPTVSRLCVLSSILVQFRSWKKEEEEEEKKKDTY